MFHRLIIIHILALLSLLLLILGNGTFGLKVALLLVIVFHGIIFIYCHIQVARNHVYIYIFFFRLHRKVISGFLSNANYMLTENGEVHITYKTAYPFRKWELVESAEEIGLFLVEKLPFERCYYLGYEQETIWR
jgi:hypothetical protein